MRHRLIVLFLFLTAATAQAQVRYVSDELVITLRTGQSTSHEIVRMLPAGTRLEVLEGDPGTRYTRVRAPDGTEGWVLSRYLTNRPIARHRLAEAQQALDRLRAKHEVLQKDYQILESERSAIMQERDRLGAQIQELTVELERLRKAAARPLQLKEENERLDAQLVQSNQELRQLRNENQQLNARTRRDWFLTGAGVVIASMLFGILLTRIRWRRRSQWDRL